jgi:hypothetical protein
LAIPRKGSRPPGFNRLGLRCAHEEDTPLQSTTPDGKSVINGYKSGDIRFNRRDRTHTELLVKGTGSAVMTELN